MFPSVPKYAIRRGLGDQLRAVALLSATRCCSNQICDREGNGRLFLFTVSIRTRNASKDTRGRMAERLFYDHSQL